MADNDACAHCDLTDTYWCPEYIPPESGEDSMSGISKETFMKMDDSSKLGVLFDYMEDIQHSQPKRVRDRDLKCERRAAECVKRFTTIEKQLKRYKVINTVAAFIGGFVGGWSAVWASFKLSLFNFLK
jgi:hypothetical protein